MSIVEQLRQERPQFYETLMKQAADEIERLRSMRECTEEQCPYEAQRAEIERLRAALRICMELGGADVHHTAKRALEQTGTEPVQSHDNQQAQGR